MQIVTTLRISPFLAQNWHVTVRDCLNEPASLLCFADALKRLGLPADLETLIPQFMEDGGCMFST